MSITHPAPESDPIGQAVAAELDRLFAKYGISKDLAASIAFATHKTDDALHAELDKLVMYGNAELLTKLTGPQAARLISEILVAIHPLPNEVADVGVTNLAKTSTNIN